MWYDNFNKNENRLFYFLKNKLLSFKELNVIKLKYLPCLNFTTIVIEDHFSQKTNMVEFAFDISGVFHSSLMLCHPLYTT